MIRTVCGPPAAGKTTWVSERAAPEDLVIDLDVLRAQYGSDELARSVRTLMENQAATYDRGDVWIIRTLADPDQRADHARRVGAEEVVVLATPEELAAQRARGRGQEMDEPISRWWATYRTAEGDTTITPDTGTDSPDKDTEMPQPQDTTPKDADPQDAPQNAGGQQTPPAQNGPAGQTGPDGGAGGEGQGFPAETPLAEMTVEQREAYWKHQSRKHESRANARSDYDALRAKAEQWDQAQREQQSPDERALHDAVETARTEARAQALAEVADERVRSAFTGSPAAREIDPQALETFLGRVNLASYVGENGAVDADAVSESLSLLSPAGTATKRAPRPTHQGYQRHEGSSSVATGAQMFKARQGAPTS